MNEKTYDLIYVGQIIDRKCPMFVVEIMKRLPKRRFLIIGDGPLRVKFYNALIALPEAHFTYIDRVPYDEMLKYFAMAKIAILPTLSDTWMITANEALAAGCPVITTPEAGCAGDLVRHGLNGWIYSLDAKLWADAIDFTLSASWPGIEQSLIAYSASASARAIQVAVHRAMESRIYRDTRKTYDDICRDCEKQEECSKPHNETICVGDRPK